jgi:hypothetical protein
MSEIRHKAVNRSVAASHCNEAHCDVLDLFLRKVIGRRSDDTTVPGPGEAEETSENPQKRARLGSKHEDLFNLLTDSRVFVKDQLSHLADLADHAAHLQAHHFLHKRSLETQRNTARPQEPPTARAGPSILMGSLFHGTAAADYGFGNPNSTSSAEILAGK